MTRKSDTVLVLRTCDDDLTSHNGFQWPKSGSVKCDDWSPEPECGNGLHGLLWGCGDAHYLNWDTDAKWLVVKVCASEIVHINGKVKYPRGEVVYCGKRAGAIKYLLANGAADKPVVFAKHKGRFTKLGANGQRLPASAKDFDAVRDNLTGLTWKDLKLGGYVTRRQAEAKAKEAGFRLPTLEELLSVVDYNREVPAIDQQFFPDVRSNWYWSSTLVAGRPDGAWFVHFGSGASYWSARGYGNGFVLACRGAGQ